MSQQDVTLGMSDPVHAHVPYTRARSSSLDGSEVDGSEDAFGSLREAHHSGHKYQYCPNPAELIGVSPQKIPPRLDERGQITPEYNFYKQSERESNYDRACTRVDGTEGSFARGPQAIMHPDKITINPNEAWFKRTYRFGWRQVLSSFVLLQGGIRDLPTRNALQIIEAVWSFAWRLPVGLLSLLITPLLMLGTGTKVTGQAIARAYRNASPRTKNILQTLGAIALVGAAITGIVLLAVLVTNPVTMGAGAFAVMVAGLLAAGPVLYVGGKALINKIREHRATRYERLHDQEPQVTSRKGGSSTHNAMVASFSPQHVPLMSEHVQKYNDYVWPEAQLKEEADYYAPEGEHKDPTAHRLQLALRAYTDASEGLEEYHQELMEALAAYNQAHAEAQIELEVDEE